MTNKPLENQKTKERNPTYSRLYELAGRARIMRNVAAETNLEALALPLNYFIKQIYNLPRDLELQTFNQWKKGGFAVKKGEKGFLFFSSPKSKSISEKETTTNKEQEINSHSEPRYFPCYLFSNEQVEKINN